MKGLKRGSHQEGDVYCPRGKGESKKKGVVGPFLPSGVGEEDVHCARKDDAMDSRNCSGAIINIGEGGEVIEEVGGVG